MCDNLMVSFCKVFGYRWQFVTETTSTFEWFNQQVFSKRRHFSLVQTPTMNDWPLQNHRMKNKICNTYSTQCQNANAVKAKHLLYSANLII